MVIKEKVNMLLLQETKLGHIDNKLCTAIWSDSNFDWKMLPTVNRGGGLLCIWRSNIFTLEDNFEAAGFNGLVGWWEYPNNRCVIVNVHSSCNLEVKRDLWAEVVGRKHVSNISAWCVAGDFNAVRCLKERRGEPDGLSQGRRECVEFNIFILDLGGLDI